MKPKIKEWFWGVLFAAVVVIGISTIRGCSDGRGYLVQGDNAYQSGDMKTALRLWRQSARWYVPFASHDDEAYERMNTLANKAKADKDVYLELDALRGIRSSVWATRHIVTPYKDLLPDVNQRIAEIMASMEDPKLEPDKTLLERQEWHLEALNRDESPNNKWVFVAALGFFLWLCSVYAFARRGFDQKGVFRKSSAVYCAMFFFLGLFLWLSGLWFA